MVLTGVGLGMLLEYCLGYIVFFTNEPSGKIWQLFKVVSPGLAITFSFVGAFLSRQKLGEEQTALDEPL